MDTPRTRMTPILLMEWWRLAVALMLAVFMAGGSQLSAGAVIVKTDQSYQLLLQSEPFELKGMCVPQAIGEDGTDYIRLAAETGANTLRTWGMDQTTPEYLAKAEAHGLLVNAGFWLRHCNPGRGPKVFSYLRDQEKLEQKTAKILEFVRAHRDHPSIILWNVGNEVMFFTNDDDERLAFCRYLEDLVRKIKAVDPARPVLHTVAGTRFLPLLKEHVPSLDLVGINTYGDIGSVHREWERLGFTIPYLITEFGPNGPWDAKRDSHGEPLDQGDYEKAFRYQEMLQDIRSLQGSCLGGFVYRLGDPRRRIENWWDLTAGTLKRESFHVVREFYAGRKPENLAPRLVALNIEQEVLKPGQKLKVTFNAHDPEKEPLQFAVTFWKIDRTHGETSITSINYPDVLHDVPEFEVTVPAESGLYKLYGLAFDGHGNVSTRNRTVRVRE